MSKIAVAIPTYNRTAFLKECVQSVLNQTFGDFDIFVFDNASTVSAEQELKKFNDSRIHFIGSEKNNGPAENFNRILRYPLHSDYVLIFHDDDAMHPRKLELQAAFLDAHPDTVFVGSDFKRASAKTIRLFEDIPTDTVPHFAYKNDYEFVKAEMSWLRFAFSSAMYRATAITGAQIRPEHFSDFADMAFLVEVSARGPTAFLQAPLINYRIHTGQDSQNRKKEYEQGAIEMLLFFKEHFPKELSAEDKKLIRSYSINFLIRAYAHMSNGFFEFLRFLKLCRQQHIIGYGSFLAIDSRGIVSLISIIFHNKRIIDSAIWLKSLFAS